IVTFPDGADSVPLKSCEITLPASLDGYTEIDVVHYGKNLADFSGHAEPTYSGLTITANADGSITFSGTPSRTWAHLTTDFAVDLPIGTYTLGRGASASYAMYIAVKYEDNTTENISMATSASKTFTTTKRIIQIRLDIATLNQSTNYNETVFVQLEAGATMTDFEPYIAPTTHTASLGRTIHGGTAEVISGQGTDSYKIVTVGNSGWNYYASGGYIYKDFNDKVTPTIGDTDHVLVTDYPDMPYGGVNYASQFQDLHIYQAQNKAIYIKDTSCTSANDFYTKYSDMQIGYELATPETFTFDPVPIDSKLGNNTIWSEQGSAEVTYYSEREVINNYNVTATQLTAIADAIREKKGTTNPILFEDFPDEIRTIETGGGGGVKSVEWVYTAGTNGTGDTYNYTAVEAGLYLAVAVRYQSTGCSIS
ncbi:hypothetical protein, partial [Bifidobacterium pseudocatenulatum]|uniref:hypothetical protein n=1 Tax=Bifidobacterium pseudocatenulatum TaxID=28026 RepID=UPI003DA43F19